MSQNISIQALENIPNENADLTTPIPIQLPNSDKFNSIELGQIKDTIYAECDTAGDVAAKVAVLSNFPNLILRQGTCVSVIFNNANTADNITLRLQNKNGIDLTGNVAICEMNTNNTRLGNGSISANSRLKLEYDGTNWQAHTEINKINSTVNGALADYQKVQQTDIADLDNITTDGIYTFNGALLDNIDERLKASDGKFYGIITVTHYGNNDISQIAQSYIAGKYNVSSRRFYGGNETWGNWEKLTTETDLENYYNIVYQMNGSSLSYFKIAEYNLGELVNINGGIGYNGNINVCQFNLNCASDLLGDFYMTNVNFKICLYKNNNVYTVYVVGFDGAKICFNSTKPITPTKIDGTPEGTLITELKSSNNLLNNATKKVLQNYPLIVSGTLSESKTVSANSFVDIVVKYSDLGFTPSKVMVQLSNRLSNISVISVSSANITSTSCNARIYNPSSSAYTLDTSTTKFFILVQK